MVGGGGAGWGCVRVDVNEEFKFWGKFKKNKLGGGGGGEGVRVDVNEEMKFCENKKKKKLGGGGGGGGGGQGGCERRNEVL